MSVTLSVINLACEVQGATLLRNISLNVAPGTMTGIIGPNGAGKSTLLKALAGVLPFQRGKIQLNDIPLQQYSAQSLAKTLAYLPQHTPVTWPLSVVQVVALGRLPHSPNGRLSAEDIEATELAIRSCSLESFRERDISTLSSGEFAMMNMARVLTTQPELILADEPAAALDPYHQLCMMEILAQRKQQNGTTSLVVLHDLSLAARWCDQLVLLDKAEVVASGTPAEVLTLDNLRRCYLIEANLIQGEFGLIPEYRNRSKHS